MDARIYFHLTDSIATAATAAELAAMRNLVQATEMHPIERRALDRALMTREASLLLVRGDVEVARSTPDRAD